LESQPSHHPPANQGTGGRPPAGYSPQGQGSASRPNSCGGDRRQNDGPNRNNNYNRNGGNGRNGNGRKSERPRCQICHYWGHEAGDCRNRYNPEFQPNTQCSGNSASTSSSDTPPPWLMDSGATDHLTGHLERLHVHDRYDGKDQVQVANGAGLSISHIGHSLLAGSSPRLNNILRVPNLHQHLLSVYRLVCDNDVFVEFHHRFFCVKEKVTK
jgi:hypothetical protein